VSTDRVENLRAWKAAYRFKLAVYELIRVESIARDPRFRNQLRDSAASAVSQIEEGFGRFYPKDFARMAVGAKASRLECCGHLRDAVDRGYIDRDTQAEVDVRGREAVRELAGLIAYLQSATAERNASRIKKGSWRDNKNDTKHENKNEK
jgi:four helix bundle protein